MKKLKHIILPLAIMLLAGCTADSEHNSEKHDHEDQSMEEQKEIIEANILVPETITPNKEVSLKVEVT